MSVTERHVLKVLVIKLQYENYFDKKTCIRVEFDLICPDLIQHRSFFTQKGYNLR